MTGVFCLLGLSAGVFCLRGFYFKPEYFVSSVILGFLSRSILSPRLFLSFLAGVFCLRGYFYPFLAGVFSLRGYFYPFLAGVFSLRGYFSGRSIFSPRPF